MIRERERMIILPRTEFRAASDDGSVYEVPRRATVGRFADVADRPKTQNRRRPQRDASDAPTTQNGIFIAASASGSRNHGGLTRALYRSAAAARRHATHRQSRPSRGDLTACKVRPPRLSVRSQPTRMEPRCRQCCSSSREL